MARDNNTSAIIDGIIRVLTFTGVAGAALVAPQIVQALDKPTSKLIDHLDDRAKQREVERLVRYMKRQGLIRGDYEHGLQVTEKAARRLRSQPYKFDIERPRQWDKHWRMVLYDIPEKQKAARNEVSKQLREVGFWQLQRSVWIFPYSCREEIAKLAVQHRVDQFITYIEINYIDNQDALIEKFRAKGVL